MYSWIKTSRCSSPDAYVYFQGMTIGKYDGYKLYLISCMDRYSVYSTYTQNSTWMKIIMSFLRNTIPVILLLISAPLLAVQNDYYFEVELSNTFSDSHGSYKSDDYYFSNVYSNEYFSVSDIHSFSFKFTHPHGFLPLIKLEHSTMSGSQQFAKLENSFIPDVSSPFVTSHNAKHTDLTFFYKIIDKRFDLLLGSSYIKALGSSTVTNLDTMEKTESNLNDSFPTLYIGTEVDISPRWKLYLDIDVYFVIIAGDDVYTDANIRTEYQFDSGLALGIGYRHDDLINYTERNHNIYGKYEGAFISIKYRF